MCVPACSRNAKKLFNLLETCVDVLLTGTHLFPRMKKFFAATESLKNMLGPEVVRTDADACFAASYDNTKLSFLP
ncbi:MAG: hypothetical protein IJW39_04685 [Opitutales bacterium]|nr:hypothetical protein [Opitutales bacterium]